MKPAAKSPRGRRPIAQPEGERSPFRIRRMGLRHLKSVVSIEMRSFVDPWSPFAIALDLRQNPQAEYFVALDGFRSVAGYAAWWNQGQTARIVKVAVSPERRKAGIGSALVRTLLESASRQGCSFAQLEVRESNAHARAMYKNLSFEEAGTVESFYGSESAVIMVRALPFCGLFAR